MSREQTSRGKLWKYLALGTGAAALVLLPVDAYITDVPVWLVMIFLAGMIGSVFMMWRSAAGRRVTRIIASVAAGVVAAVAVYSCFLYPYWNSVSSRGSVSLTKALDAALTPEEAREDITYAYRMILKTHPVLRQSVPEDFAQAAEEAHEAVRAADSLSVAELARLVGHMSAVLGDAHTSVRLRNLEGEKYLASAGVHARRGDRLQAVNGIPIEQIMLDKADLLSFETPAWERLLLEDYLISDTGLALLDMPAESLEYTFETRDGELISEKTSAEEFVPLASLLEITQQEFPPGEQDDPWVSYTIDPEHSLAVLVLNECTNNADYIACLHDMFTEVKNLGIENVAVDLRGNGGGDSSVATEFIRYLPVDTYSQMGLTLRNGPFLITYPSQTLINEQYTDLVFGGSVYVLTSPATFSSAMLFAEYLGDNGLAQLVGEAPGNITDGYGEVVTFQLPNSGLLLGVSSKQFQRLQSEKGSVLTPDVETSSGEALETLKDRLRRAE